MRCKMRKKSCVIFLRNVFDFLTLTDWRQVQPQKLRLKQQNETG